MNPTRLGPVDAIPVGEGRAYDVGGNQVAVFHLRDGTPRATQAVCPHAGGPLADGRVDPRTLVCPLHPRMFSLDDGGCVEGDGIALHTARVEEGQTVVEVWAPGRRRAAAAVRRA